MAESGQAAEASLISKTVQNIAETTLNVPFLNRGSQKFANCSRPFSSALSAGL
jgi:hypothetical protein